LALAPSNSAIPMVCEKTRFGGFFLVYATIVL